MNREPRGGERSEQRAQPGYGLDGREQDWMKRLEMSVSA
jgi:hypothetical protein